MSNKVPEVPGQSWAAIDQKVSRVLSAAYPHLLRSPGPFPVLDFLEFRLPQICGYTLAIEELPPNIEAQTDFVSREIILSEDTYATLHVDDPRSRFTAMHEVGHALLHSEYFEEIIARNIKTVRLARASIKAFKDPECQANVFAASILMPTKHVKQILEINGGAATAVLTAQFLVSWEAAQHRISGLDKFIK